MRRPIVIGSGAVVLFLMVSGVPSFAKTPPPPLHQECGPNSNGGTLVNNICVLPQAIDGGANDYFGYVVANNGEAADTFKIVSGSLPAGLSMPSHYGVADTLISGDATQLGTFTFVVKAAYTPERLTSLQTYSITVTPEPPDTLVCTPDTNGGTLVNGVCVLPAAPLGQIYEGFIETSNNSGGSFSIISGNLPPGLMFGPGGASGVIIAGTPTQEGTFPFTIKGTDGEGQPLEQAYSITVGPPLPLTDTTITAFGPGTIGSAFAENFSLSGGVAPYTWTLVSGQLPPGLSLVSTDAPSDNDNQLAGTPTTAGTFVFSMKVTDSLGSTARGQVTLTIDPRPPLQISGTGVCCSVGKVGTAYPYIAFGAIGGETPYTWTVASGQVPTGLTFSSGNPGTFINNVLSGTPTKAGTFDFTMKVTDELGDTASQAFSITINS